MRVKLLTVWAMVKKFGPRILRALLGEDDNYARERRYWDDMY